MNIKSFLLLAFTLVCVGVYGQDGADTKPMTKEEKKAAKKAKKNAPPEKGTSYITFIPALSSNPSFGFMYGAAISASTYRGDPSTTNISTGMLSLTFTTKNQTLLVFKSTIFGENNKSILDLDWRYLGSSQATFGVGSGPLSTRLASNGFEIDEGFMSAPIDDGNLLSFDWIRLHQTYFKSVRPGVFLGLGYHLDNIQNIRDNLTNLDTSAPVLSSYGAYCQKYDFDSTKSLLSGVSLNAKLDTRDNMNEAYRGTFGFIRFKINPTFLGSTKNSTELWMELRKYINLTPVNNENILALWAIGNFNTSGDLPYMNLPALGYDQYSGSGRGYTQGRIRGQSFAYGEIEYRRKLFSTPKIKDFFGMNFFANVTTASNKDNPDVNLFSYLDPAYGLGFRLMLNPKSRTTLSLDYAQGNYGSSGFYFMLNEFF